MVVEMREAIWRWTAAVAIVVIGLACAPADGRPRNTAAEHAAATQPPVIDHVTPRRDSIGKAPAQFEWTRIEGADTYAIGIWNEVDVMLWRQDNIHENRVARPEELQLDPGTYLWSITALRAGQVIAESGLAAFIVRTDR
jgi:hypothetical protein